MERTLLSGWSMCIAASYQSLVQSPTFVFFSVLRRELFVEARFAFCVAVPPQEPLGYWFARASHWLLHSQIQGIFTQPGAHTLPLVVSNDQSRGCVFMFYLENLYGRRKTRANMRVPTSYLFREMGTYRCSQGTTVICVDFKGTAWDR